MPKYDYHCAECDYTFEAVAGLTAYMHDCPECGRKMAKRQAVYQSQMVAPKVGQPG